jgi:hypothetical protein
MNLFLTVIAMILTVTSDQGQTRMTINNIAGGMTVIYKTADNTFFIIEEIRITITTVYPFPSEYIRCADETGNVLLLCGNCSIY